MRKLLFLFGTRPEAIKLCPIITYLSGHPETGLQARVVVSAQHRGLLDRVLDTFSVTPHHDLNVMTPGQTLHQSTSRILAALEPVLQAERPDLVLVQGDTTTVLCGALSAFYERIPVAHVEAGLRTGDYDHPFPEEMNRVLAGRLASLHLAPTEWARRNLLAEGVPDSQISVTGNSGIDALLGVAGRLERGDLDSPELIPMNGSRRLVVVTAHRRENFGAAMENICESLRRLARRPDVQIAFPVHPNPRVRETTSRVLSNQENIYLLPPLDYVPFVDLMRRAHMLITDSGGVQEEAPSLGKPVLVLREKTERPEAVEAGTVELVGSDATTIERAAVRLLEDSEEYGRRTRIHNPYGDGHASGRIVAAISAFLSERRAEKALSSRSTPG